MKKRCVAGSYTVEAALLLPTILAMFSLLIYTSFYLHNTVAIKCNIYEENLLGITKIRRDIEDSEMNQMVHLSGSLQVPIGGLLEQIMRKPIWAWQETRTIFKMNPVVFIQKIRKTQDLLEWIHK